MTGAGAQAADGRVPPGWKGILEPGEDILWQGRPEQRIAWTGTALLLTSVGLGFAGFAVFWMLLAAQAGGGFWMFGLIHFFLGLTLAAGPLFWTTWRRRHTWYTLTDRRACIATDIPGQGRLLKDYPIGPETEVELTGGATIRFAHAYRRTKDGTFKTPVGFERIRNADAVFGLLRQVQRREPAA